MEEKDGIGCTKIKQEIVKIEKKEKKTNSCKIYLASVSVLQWQRIKKPGCC